MSLKGKPLGLHKQGYTSFSLRLDNVDGANFGGENVLAVYVDATTGTGWWYEGGGLFRHQYLIQTQRVHLATDMAWVYNNVTAAGVRAVRRPIPPRWRPIQFRWAPRTYAPPHGDASCVR